MITISARRRELMAIAATAFAERGFLSTTMDEIGQRAGISGPALYHHFASKEALLDEMLIDVSVRLVNGATAICQSPSPDRLRRLVAAHCAFAVEEPALITVQFRDLVNASDAACHEVRQTQGRYVSLWIAELRATQPELDRRRARAAVQAVLGLINSTPFSGNVGRTSLVEMLEQMAMCALAAAGRSG